MIRSQILHIFVYDGVPDWKGSINPGSTPEITFNSKMLNSVAVYQLLTGKADTENSTWLKQDSSSEYRNWGTLVYGSQVLDHIQFRSRGGVWRYSMGKNMWKFRFNLGHDLEARDNYGKKYKTPWNTLNLGANIQQGDYRHRGEQGMFESVGFPFIQHG